MPLRVRWIACWPVLLCIYLAGFQVSHIMANMLLQTAMRLHWSYALAISPILADILLLLIVLPAIRLLVPARQHLVVFGFALIVGIATLSAVSTLLAKDYLRHNRSGLQLTNLKTGIGDHSGMSSTVLSSLPL